MKLSASALLAVATGVGAVHVVEFNLRRGLPGVRLGASPVLSKRATYVQELANNITGGGYFAEVMVGTPGQPVTMVLDTGSSDVWVVSYKANLCTSALLQEQYQDSCGATFNPSKSETVALVENNGFPIKYLDGSTAEGDYIADTFAIGGTTIEALQMGYATKVVRGTGVLGIGFGANVAADEQYPNIMDQLTAQGRIAVKAYSLYLNDRRSASGSILLGGIDTGRFIDKLHVLPITRNITGSYTAFEVAFTGMAITYTNGSSATISDPLFSSLPAILDSGSTMSYLPDSIARRIFRQLGAVTDAELGLTFIDYSYLTDEPGMTISFRFGRATITVPVHEMVLDLLGSYQHLLPSSIPYDRVCVFGILTTADFETSGAVPDSDMFALLGDTFLRSAYVVYDLDHYQIGMAQANLNSTTSNVIELKAGGSSLPSVTGVAAQQTSSPTSGGGGGGGVATVTVTQNAAPGSVRLSGSMDVLAVVAVTSLFVLVGGALVAL